MTDDTTTTTDERPWFKRKRFLIPLVLVLLIGIGMAMGGGEDDPESVSSSESTSSTVGDDEAAEEEQSTTSTTRQPTTTTTEKPTTTTTAPPQPVTYEGDGDDVIAITKPEPGPAIAVFSHTGSRNFIVTGLDTNRERVGGLVNEIGSWVGSVPLDINDDDETTYLEIQADGHWRVDLQPLSMARRFDPSTTGRGTEFFFYEGTGGIAQWTHTGERNFIVTLYSDVGRDGLVNEIGPYDGKVSMDGPAFVEVMADGDWSVTVE